MNLALILALSLPLLGQSVATWAPEREPVTLSWCLATLPASPSEPEVRGAINEALREWSKYVQITFRPGKCGEWRTLTFSWLPAEHGDGYPFGRYGFAHAFYPAGLSPEPAAGDVHFSRDERWTPGEIYLVSLHEIGHALGLMHGNNPWGVMYSVENGVERLQRSDIDAIRWRYAKRCFEVGCAWGLNK